MYKCSNFISMFRLLPKARVVYCSATGVSEVKNLVSAHSLEPSSVLALPLALIALHVFIVLR